MRRSLGRVFLASLALSCAPAKPAQTTPSKAAEAAKANGPRERLAQALRVIPRPEPVLAALPLEAQQRLQARFAGLDAERKLAVHDDDSPLVETLPLLHLVAGGTSPRALYALTTSSAGSEELAGLLGVEHDPSALSPDAARVALVRELARRAALNFLRDRSADVTQGGKGSALVCRLVARAAQAVGRAELVLLARELLATVEPEAENRLEFARELARSGDAEGATQRVDEARKDKRRPASPALLADTQRLIDAARVATAKPEATPSLDAKLLRARAWLRLGRTAEARALLAGESAAAKARLDVAAVVAETLLEIPSCPDLSLDIGSASLCAVAYRISERAKQAHAVLEFAWQTGTGRDDEAIEVYAALNYVIPWLHETAAAIAQGALGEQESAVRVQALHQKLTEIAVVSPRLAGLALFLQTVHSGPARRVSGLRAEPEAEALFKRARELAEVDSSRFAQAGILAVAAALSHQRDVAPLLALLPLEKTQPSLRVPRASLEVWAAASSGQRERMDAARGELATIMSEGLGASLERARLVLGVSEADALLGVSERSYQLLSRVSGQLLNENIPPDLALRAVLDAAGALAHGGRFEQADKVLSGAVSAELPPDLERASDLLALIRGYKLVLGAQGAPGSVLPQLRSKLAALAPAKAGQATAVWFDLWSREIDALEREAGCAKKKLKTCREAEALRRDARRDVPARLGSAASAVLAQGALPSGSFDAGFRFTVENGLEPLILFDPSFLPIGLPKLAGP